MTNFPASNNEGPSRGGELPSPTGKRLWKQLLDAFYGYDFFIAYRWEDGRTYAVSLYKGLQDRGFDCFLDSEQSAAGESWKTAGAMAIRKTSRLVLVGSPGVTDPTTAATFLQQKEDPIVRELRIYSTSGRRIIPIDFGCSIDPKAVAGTPLQEFLPAEMLRVKEAPARLREGPSSNALDEIQRGFDSERQTSKRMRGMKMVAGIIAGLFLIAAGLAVLALLAQRQAKRETAIAEDRLANAQRAEVEALAEAKRWAECKTAARNALALFTESKRNDLPIIVELWNAYKADPPPLYEKQIPKWHQLSRTYLMGAQTSGPPAWVATRIDYHLADEPGSASAHVQELDLLTGRLGTATTTGTDRVISLAHQKFPGTGATWDPIPLPGGARLVLESDQVRLLQTNSPLFDKIPTTGEYEFDVAAVSPDGRLLALARRKLVLVDCTTGRRLEEYILPDQASAVQFADDNRRIVLAAAHFGERNLSPPNVYTAELDLLSGAIGRHCVLPGGVRSPAGKGPALAPGGATAAGWGTNRTLILWRRNGLGFLPLRLTSSTPPSHAAPATLTPDLDEVGFSSNGRYILAWGRDGPVAVWDVEDGKQIFSRSNDPTINPDDLPMVSSIGVADNGRLLLGWTDGRVQFSQVPEGPNLLEMPLSAPPALSECFDNLTLLKSGGLFLRLRPSRISLYSAEDLRELASISISAQAAYAPPTVFGERLLLRRTNSWDIFYLDRVRKIMAWEPEIPGLLATLQERPLAAAALVRLGNWYSFCRQWQRGREAFELARVADAHLVPQVTFAQCLWMSGDPAGAKKALRDATAREPTAAAYIAVCLRCLDKELAGQDSAALSPAGE